VITIATVTGGAIIGFVIGAWIGERQGGDYNFAPLFIAPAGGMIGAIGGAVIGALVT
jgi:hypothetical protein